MKFSVDIRFVEMIGFELVSCDAGEAEMVITLRDDGVLRKLGVRPPPA